MNENSETSTQEKIDLSLEDIIILANKIGLEYVDKKRDAERLELFRTSLRAKIMNRIEEQSLEKMPEAKLKRLAEADDEYITMLEKIAQTRADAERLHVRYESYRNLFDAKRTIMSYKRLELKSL